jgi:hypothetical protein
LPDRSFTLIPGELEVEVLESIDTRSWKVETGEDHGEQVQGIVHRALRPAQRPFEPPPR